MTDEALVTLRAVRLAMVFGWTLPAAPAAAQSGIDVGRSMVVSADAPTNPHAETHLAMDPKNPKRMLATSIVYSAGKATSAVYASGDGGRSWRRAKPDSTLPPFAGGDPIVDFTQGGAALFGAIDGYPDGFRVWRSSDGGARWDGVTTVPGGIYDRQYFAVDRTSGRFSGRIYASGLILVRKPDGGRYPVIAVSSSTDDGRTFRPATFLDAGGGGQTPLGSVVDLVVTRQGALVVPFVAGSPTRLSSVVSRDGGVTFSAPRPGPTVGYGSGYRFVKALSGRHAAVDTSAGPFADRIYVTWVDFSEDRFDVKVTYSDDLGLTWSPPVTVNDDAGPTDPSNAAITVNRDGAVVVVFNDRRDDPRNACYRLYASVSLDGGDTFLPNVPVNRNPTCPSAPGNWPGTVGAFPVAEPEPHHQIQVSGVPERFPNGGETQGLVAGPDGRVHVAWINGQSGVMQLWYTELSVRGVVRRRRVERTTDLEIVTGDPVVDFSGKSFGFSVRLRNISADSIAGPIVLVLDRFKSGLGGLTPANADTARSRGAAQWVFTLDGRGALLPGEVTETRQLRWRFDGKIPPEPAERFRGWVRIFQERGTARRG